MVSLSTIETDLAAALKARDSVRTDTLRGLKTRLQNEQIAAMQELGEDKIVALIRSEVKRRKEAAEAFSNGGRADQAAKELQEAEILSSYVPAGPSEQDMQAQIDRLISEHGFTTKDFGQAMGKLKAALPAADGAELARLLKEKLS